MRTFAFIVVAALAVLSPLTALAQPTPAPAPRGNAGGRGGGPPGATLANRMITQGDLNSDRTLTKSEFAALPDLWFDRLDPDRVGRVTQEEFLQRFEGIFAAPAAAVGGRGGRGGGAGTIGNFFILDGDHNSILQRAELKVTFETWFPKWDGNNDGSLDLDELTAGLSAALPRTNIPPGGQSSERIPGLPTQPPSPILAPAESMSTIRLVDGLKLELTASEPMIEDPVALSFDEDGRAYVVEMRGYMLDIDRTGERDPISRISRLEDTDGDGRFDKSTVFVDNLILPRAVAAMAGGIFYVSDYRLYFARDTDGDGKSDKTELVDANYGGGNVEHAPNALFRAMDNWIYNGESPTRYRLVNGTLVRQATEQRGQWGMTQDNYGRLLYNVNNSQLLGDFTPPNYMGRNPNHQTSAGLNLFVATDQRVFPIRMNTAINRGYSSEVLDPKTGRSYIFASSCGPVVYRGDNLPAEFVGSAFVADAALNLIKRNLLFDQNLTLSSRYAYDDREFLASTDERFRPANLYNGPDGALWIIDLYHGVAQYSSFMTAYLRRETLERGLDQGIHHGRIYRVVSTTNKPAAFPRLSGETSAALVGRLSAANGWTRDAAQRILVERGDRTVVPALAQLVQRGSDPLGRIHALWTLEGLFTALPAGTTAANATPGTAPMVSLLRAGAGFALEAPALPPEVLQACLDAVGDPNPKVQVAAIRVAESLTAAQTDRQRALLQRFEQLKDGASDEVAFQVALTAGNLAKPEALPVLARVATSMAEHLAIREAMMSSLANWELQFLNLLLTDQSWSEQRPGRSALLQALASAVIKERQPAKIEMLLLHAANQKPGETWRRRSLLDGIAANANVRPVRLIAFDRVPAGFDSLSKSDDAALRQQIETIGTLFAWPGHQSEAATANPVSTPALTADETSRIAAGEKLFQQSCFACHGLNGQGVVPLGPPLASADWVLGADSRLIRIILQGVAGPIEVNGRSYQPPNILPDMPAFGSLDDAQIAAVLSYLRRSWGHEAAPIAPARVATIRQETAERKTPWTPAQLLEIK